MNENIKCDRYPERCYECRFAECHFILSVILYRVSFNTERHFILSVNILSVLMMNVVMLSVVPYDAISLLF
jgi:hypothetical protein